MEKRSINFEDNVISFTSMHNFGDDCFESINYGDGYGYGQGDGRGDGDGHGNVVGSGFGDGEMYGDAEGNGFGYGNGNMVGDGRTEEYTSIF